MIVLHIGKFGEGMTYNVTGNTGRFSSESDAQEYRATMSQQILTNIDDLQKKISLRYGVLIDIDETCEDADFLLGLIYELDSLKDLAIPHWRHLKLTLVEPVLDKE